MDLQSTRLRYFKFSFAIFSQSTNFSKFGINNFLNRWANHGLSFVYFHSFQTQILQQKLQFSEGFKLGSSE